MLRIFLTMSSLFFLLGCANEPFPVEFIYHVDIQKQICDQYRIDKDTVKAKFEKSIPFAQCPVIFGFEQKDIGPLMNWIRTVKKKVEKCK